MELRDVIRRDVGTDTKFRRRMRLHQAWWRQSKGFGFGHDSVGELGSLLAPEDAEAGKNFLTPAIAELAFNSVGRHVEPKRLKGNLLSSQPMAFNLFGPLVIDPALARRLIEPLLGEPLAVASVEIEVTPEKKEIHLNDETSFDALIRYTTKSGQSGVVAIETKLTESFSPVTEKPNADRSTYREVARAANLYKDPDCDALVSSECWQMWRNHLLAVKFCENSFPPGSVVRSWVVRHDDDGNGAASVAAYKDCLQNPDRDIRELTLSELISAWEKVLPPRYEPWLAEFRNRYVDLSGSDFLAQQQK